MTKDETLKIANDIAIGVDVTKDGTHVIAMRLRPDGVNVVMYSQFHPLAQPEPVKIAHKHEWFRTGEMKVGQMRCISCGTWGQEEMPQRTWVGLTDEEMQDLWDRYAHMEMMRAIEAKLKEKNT